MSEYTNTNNAFAKLREVTTDEINAFNEAFSDNKILDSYGNKTPKIDLYLYKRFPQSSRELQRFYLLPYNKIDLANTPAISASSYEAYNADKIEFINKSPYSEDNANLVHLSDFIRCSSSNRYGSYHNMVQLSHQWYDEPSYVFKNLVYQANYHLDCFILKEDAFSPFGSYRYFHKEDTDNIVWSTHHDDYLWVEDARYPDDDENTAYHVDYIFYDDRDDCYYTTRERASENRIRDYHCTPNGTYYLAGDIKDPKDVLANYTVGFEIEKCSIEGSTSEGDSHDYEELFAGWETDSSCGVEGITNIYSLNNTVVFDNHVNNSYYVNEETDRRCGGHINISDKTNRIRFWHIKNWIGLWYAMFRKRLTNEYASNNKKACPYMAKSGPKYQAIREKSFDGGHSIYELRLPSRVKSGTQLKRRFRLCQAWMKCIHAYANEDWSYTTANYDDQYWGMPNWALENTKGVNELDMESYKREAEKVAKQTAELLSKHVSKPTALRMRYLIEQSKDELLQSYECGLSLLHVIQLAYAFQTYCEVPDTETAPNELLEYIGAYL